MKIKRGKDKQKFGDRSREKEKDFRGMKYEVHEETQHKKNKEAELRKTFGLTKEMEEGGGRKRGKRTSLMEGEERIWEYEDPCSFSLEEYVRRGRVGNLYERF